jgi:hypothetical protein
MPPSVDDSYRIFRHTIRPTGPVPERTAGWTLQGCRLTESGGFLWTRRMLRGLLLAMALLMPFVSGQSRDPYALALVSEAMEHYGHFSTGWEDKGLPRLGDKGAIALIKLSSLDAWKDVSLVHKSLGIIGEAFSHPELIENPSDRQPHVTHLLLAWLRSIHEDRETRNEIDRTEKFVEQQTRAK